MLCANVTLEPGLRESSCENDNPAGKTQADTPTTAQITHNPELDRAPTGVLDPADRRTGGSTSPRSVS